MHSAQQRWDEYQMVVTYAATYLSIAIHAGGIYNRTCRTVDLCCLWQQRSNPTGSNLDSSILNAIKCAFSRKENLPSKAQHDDESC